MRLTAQQKTAGMLATLLAINDTNFEVNERASALKFEALFTAGEVFVDDLFQTRAFAIVTDRDGPYLVVIAVTRGLQKCGIGTKLLREIEDFYHQSDEDEVEIKLTCKIANWQAQRLYLKLGYRPVRVIPGYYGTEDGLLMGRVL
jgi:ribosomal-protein-alanine N-acetyltransferase